MVMVLNVPKEIKIKDGVEVPEYRGGEVSDRIYHAVLRQCYHMYRFHHGQLQGKLTLNSPSGASEEQRLQLSAELKDFYDAYLANFKVLEKCDIVDMLHSIQYLALDKALFLRAHNFSMLCDTFPVIKECVMLYNEQVVCGGKLSASDLYSLHAHIQSTATSDNANDSYRNGAFMQNDGAEEIKPLTIYLDANGQIEPHYLLVYRALNLTLCLFLDGKRIQFIIDFQISILTEFLAHS